MGLDPGPDAGPQQEIRMQYRRLGSTGLPISALSFGAWVTFGDQIPVSYTHLTLPTKA